MDGLFAIVVTKLSLRSPMLSQHLRNLLIFTRLTNVTSFIHLELFLKTMLNWKCSFRRLWKFLADILLFDCWTFRMMLKLCSYKPSFIYNSHCITPGRVANYRRLSATYRQNTATALRVKVEAVTNCLQHCDRIDCPGDWTPDLPHTRKTR